MATSQGVQVIPFGYDDTICASFYMPLEAGLLGLLADPLCNDNASSLIFMENTHIQPVPLFASTPLSENMPVSPWIVTVHDMDNAFLQWVWHESPSGWGLIFYSPYKWVDVCAHLRSLVVVHEIFENKKRELVFRFWDNRIFMRIAKELPQACARIMGPIQTIVTQDEWGNWFMVQNSSPLAKEATPASPWYIFDEKHAELFSDKIMDVLAYKITESLYDVAEEESIPTPAAESLQCFVRRQIESVYPIGLKEQEHLTSYVLCALYMGEAEAFRQASEIKSGHAEVLKSLWKKCAETVRQEEILNEQNGMPHMSDA